MLNARNDKSLVIIIVRDHSGCSHVRLRWNAMYYNGFDQIGFTPIITPQPIFDATILKQTKAILSPELTEKDREPKISPNPKSFDILVTSISIIVLQIYKLILA